MSDEIPTAREWNKEYIDRVIEENKKNRSCRRCAWSNNNSSSYWCTRACNFEHDSFTPRAEGTEYERRKERKRLQKEAEEKAKKLLSILIVLFVSCVFVSTANAEVSEYKDTQAMWELVSDYSPSDYITAAVVGHIDFESHCVSNVVGGGYLLGDDYDEKVTAAIDEGLTDGSTKDEFCKHKIGKYQVWGYGLIQWVDPTECGKLYDYAQACGTSIGDAQTQVAFIFDNVKNNFPDVWQKLLDAESAADAGRIFAHFVGGTDLAEKLEDRAWFAEELIKQFGD